MEDKETKYVSVVFEKPGVPFSESEDCLNFYRSSQHYTYKTDKTYKAGQIIYINSFNGRQKVLVVNPEILKETITFPLEKIKPLVEYQVLKEGTDQYENNFNG